MRDKERGVVWEETIILLPDNVHYVFLSATIPNARQFAEWIAHLHKQVRRGHVLDSAVKESFTDSPEVGMPQRHRCFHRSCTGRLTRGFHCTYPGVFSLPLPSNLTGGFDNCYLLHITLLAFPYVPGIPWVIVSFYSLVTLYTRTTDRHLCNIMSFLPAETVFTLWSMSTDISKRTTSRR